MPDWRTVLHREKYQLNDAQVYTVELSKCDKKWYIYVEGKLPLIVPETCCERLLGADNGDF